MENVRESTIKGIFVNSHLKALQRLKGEEGLQELERRLGGPLRFRNSEDVAVRREVAIIDGVLDILHGGTIPSHLRDFEAGRLHFRNFTATPLARIVFSLFRKDLKLMMMHAHHIAGHVFQGTKFSSDDLGPTSVRVTMDGLDYPIDHFKGLLHEWMHFAGYSGTVECTAVGPYRHAYTLTWSCPPTTTANTEHTSAKSFAS